MSSKEFVKLHEDDVQIHRLATHNGFRPDKNLAIEYTETKILIIILPDFMNFTSLR